MEIQISWFVPYFLLLESYNQVLSLSMKSMRFLDNEEVENMRPAAWSRPSKSTINILEIIKLINHRFMTLWDGLTSSNQSGLPARIMILGATNRIQDIDEAILRRMPKKFPVSLPSNSQRRRILKLILKDTKTDTENFDIEYLTRVMAGMSGSDIKEACRDAAMVPVREFIKSQRDLGVTMSGVNAEAIRGVRTEDFFGRKGGGQIIKDNHARQSSKLSKKQNGKQAADSGDEYEDVEDSEPLAEPMD
ncbi:ATPase family aaa domain-containing protein 1 [Phlyctema vagabunda]|uniref:ATPase family aaa domain-containing protein 1 n=1 Tax=Phlyctema vagabunda TaxID=108571 RepID=A0ABR4P4V9_9HELO